MNNHPTIDLTSAPPQYFCPSSVYNCIKFCFKANDYVLEDGDLSGFLIGFVNSSEPIGSTIVIGNYTFTAAASQSYNTFIWDSSALVTGANFIQMLKNNYYFGCNFDFTLLTNGAVVAVSKEVGYLADWTITAPSGINTLPFVGADPETQANYKLVLEVWECDPATGETVGLPVIKLGYDPDAESNGEICVNLEKYLQPYVSTTFRGLDSSSLIAYDETIWKLFCLRYGEIYNEGDACESEPRFFEMSSTFPILNTAIQKDDTEGLEPHCYLTGETSANFLTDRPNLAPLCLNSHSWLYHIANEYVYALIQSGYDIKPIYKFTYVDGTSNTVIGTLTSTGLITQGGVVIIPTGLAQVGNLTIPSKTVSQYGVYIGVTGNGLASPVAITPVMYYSVADGTCCGAEFYFLNEKGGIDTLVANPVQEQDLTVNSSELCGFMECEAGINSGGKFIADIEAYDTFKVTTKFLNKYEARQWVKQFFKSPVKKWKNAGKVYDILIVENQIPMYRKDADIAITFSFKVNFNHNQQSN